MLERRGLAVQIGTVSLIGVLTQLAFLIANVILGRNLSPGDFGRADLANKLINLSGYLGLFGLNAALLRAMPRHDLPRFDWPAAAPRVGLIAGMVALSAGVLAARLYGLSVWQAGLLSAAALFLSLSIAASSILAIDRRFALAQWLQQLWRPALLLGTLSLLLAGQLSLTSVLCLYATAGLLQVFLAAFAIRGVPRGGEPLPMGRLLREGAIFFGLFLTSSLMLRLDAFFLAGLISAEALGRYAAASNIALTGYGILAAGVAQVVTPRIVSGEGLGLRRLLIGLTVLAGGAGALLTWIGSPLLHLIYGGQYGGDFQHLLGLLCLAGIIQVAYVVPSAWLGAVASEKALRLFLAVNILSLGINVILNTLLIPRFGLEGAALATAASWAWRWAWAIGFVIRIRSHRGTGSKGNNATNRPPPADQESTAI
ncbi:MAG: oligosaccharide flippase family protein [Candidatus Eisenbacteria bacterium]|nr:oligosaccharide flippase family protein [Candidatus Eisenbacteria bacterium]